MAWRTTSKSRPGAICSVMLYFPPFRLFGQKIQASSRTHVYDGTSLLELYVANKALYQVAESDASPKWVIFAVAAEYRQERCSHLLPGRRASRRDAVHDDRLACNVGGRLGGELRRVGRVLVRFSPPAFLVDENAAEELADRGLWQLFAELEGFGGLVRG